jgi:hypothetical protein
MALLREKLYYREKHIKIKLKCNKHCFWFDWFDYIRKQLAKDNNATLEYMI